MPQLEHHPLARRQLAQHLLHSFPNLPAEQIPLRIPVHPLLRYRVHSIQRPIRRREHRRFFLPHFPLAHLIQTQIGRDPVQPRMKTTVETERVQIPVDPQKYFLIYVVSVLGRLQQVHRQPEHTLVVGAYELLEGGMIARLRRPDQRPFIHPDARFQGHDGGSALSVQHSLGRNTVENVTFRRLQANPSRHVSTKPYTRSSSMRLLAASRLAMRKVRIWPAFGVWSSTFSAPPDFHLAASIALNVETSAAGLDFSSSAFAGWAASLHTPNTPSPRSTFARFPATSARRPVTVSPGFRSAIYSSIEVG